MGKLILALVTTAGLAVASTASASDHLANATAASGSNPVTANPSGVSGSAAQPGTVPGEGNPNFGQDQGTPSVDTSQLNCTAQEHIPPDPLDPAGCF